MGDYVKQLFSWDTNQVSFSYPISLSIHPSKRTSDVASNIKLYLSSLYATYPVRMWVLYRTPAEECFLTNRVCKTCTTNFSTETSPWLLFRYIYIYIYVSLAVILFPFPTFLNTSLYSRILFPIQ